jgi:ureidoglycolate lyase
VITLKPAPLTREAFAPFGDVIATSGAEHFPINEGTTERFHDLAAVDIAEAGGRTLINIFRGQPRDLPLAIRMMERHPLASQAFIPTGPHKWLAVVAPAGAPPKPSDLRAFVAGAGQGVNYHRGVWHHPLIALEAVSDFVVVDRGGGGGNCDEYYFAESEEIILSL